MVDNLWSPGLLLVACIGLLVLWFGGKRPAATRDGTQRGTVTAHPRYSDSDAGTLHCSFCGASQHDVRKLIAGPEAFICDGCVARFDQIPRRALESVGAGMERRNPTPPEICTILDRFVTGQADAKRRLSIAIRSYYKGPVLGGDALPWPKPNILLIGPSGSGRRALARSIAAGIDIPFATVDATVIAEESNERDNLAELMALLLHSADWNSRRAERGIIYVDGLNAVRWNTDERDVLLPVRPPSGRPLDPQELLVELMNGTYVWFSPKFANDASKRLGPMPTAEILFICGANGADLEPISSARREREQPSNSNSKLDPLESRAPQFENALHRDDLLRFGLIPELVDSLPMVLVVGDPDFEPPA